MPITRTWQPDEVSYAGDIVTHDGATWQAIRDTGRSPGERDWVCLARAGHDGATPRPRGTYREGSQYRELDIVALNGCSFIAKKDDPGPCPGDGWQALTLPGKRGDKGEKGERGPAGERGEVGPAGVGIIGWKVDDENYEVKAVLSDGSELPLPLRTLFERYQSETDHG